MPLHWPVMWFGLYNGISPIVVYNSPLGSPFCKHSSFTCCTTSNFNQRGLLHRMIPNLNLTQWLNLGDILSIPRWVTASRKPCQLYCRPGVSLTGGPVPSMTGPASGPAGCWKAANQGRMLAMIQREALRGVEIHSNFESPRNSTTRTLQTSVFSLFQIYINRYTDIPVITSVFPHCTNI